MLAAAWAWFNGSKIAMWAAAAGAALRVHDWREFARGYNGAGQVARYAGLLKAAWKRHGGGA